MAKKKIERKYMAHFIDSKITSSSPSWYRIGEDLSTFEVEMNPNYEIVRDMQGGEHVFHDGYEPESETEIFYARETDSLFNLLQEIVDTMGAGDICKTHTLDVHMWDDGYELVDAASWTNPNPEEHGWYEKVNNKYVLTEDTTMVSGKVYYFHYYAAIKRNCYLTPLSFGGDTSGYQIPFTMRYYGDTTSGRYEPVDRVFIEY